MKRKRRKSLPTTAASKAAARTAIARGYGLLKRAPDAPPLQAEWAEHKREERAIEP